jgi:polar amino acid transport system substrate-binding protein
MAALAITSPTLAQSLDPATLRELAPGGRLRAAINFGNPVLAKRDPATGSPRGVSVELAQILAQQLGVPLDLVAYDAAGKVTEAAGSGAWDIAFLAIDPLRANDIAFTPPYVLIEGTYMVRMDSPLRRIEEVDRQGLRILVGRGSAYDLYLTRVIKNATLVRVASSALAITDFAAGSHDVAAGVRQPLVDFAQKNPGFRVMDGRFMAIEQAMGTPQGRPQASAYLKRFIEEMKSSGLIARVLKETGEHDAIVAPASN